MMDAHTVCQPSVLHGAIVRECPRSAFKSTISNSLPAQIPGAGGITPPATREIRKLEDGGSRPSHRQTG